MIRVQGNAKYSPEPNAPAYFIQIPDLELYSQAESLEEIPVMVDDLVGMMFEEAGIEGYEILWEKGSNEHFLIGTKDVPGLLAFIMRRKRGDLGVSVTELAERMGYSSHNSIAAYEQASRSPSVEKFAEIADGLGYELVIELKKKVG